MRWAWPSSPPARCSSRYDHIGRPFDDHSRRGAGPRRPARGRHRRRRRRAAAPDPAAGDRALLGDPVHVLRERRFGRAAGTSCSKACPGVAKTLTATTIARAISAEFHRIQLTPDLLPADIIGTRIYDAETGHFRTEKGPVFTNILLADEINRATPKTQSALLEAMQERQVTIADTSYPLPDPFWVLATQNPVEQEGVYPAARGAAGPLQHAAPRRLSGTCRRSEHAAPGRGAAEAQHAAGAWRRRPHPRSDPPVGDPSTTRFATTSCGSAAPRGIPPMWVVRTSSRWSPWACRRARSSTSWRCPASPRSSVAATTCCPRT